MQIDHADKLNKSEKKWCNVLCLHHGVSLSAFEMHSDGEGTGTHNGLLIFETKAGQIFM